MVTTHVSEWSRIHALEINVKLVSRVFLLFQFMKGRYFNFLLLSAISLILLYLPSVLGKFSKSMCSETFFAHWSGVGITGFTQGFDSTNLRRAEDGVEPEPVAVAAASSFS